MPKTKRQPKQTPKKRAPVIATPKLPKLKDLPILHPAIRSEVYDGDSALRAADARDMLGHQTLNEFLAEQADQHEEVSADDLKGKLELPQVTYKSPITKEECICWNSLFNRFIDAQATTVIGEQRQDILTGNWAGPTTLEGETEGVYGGEEPFSLNGHTYLPGDKISVPLGTVNGEPIIVSQRGQITSGLKRLLALIDAREEWDRNPEKYPKWKTEPVLETTVIYGTSDDPRIVQTNDNTHARTESHTFFVGGSAGRILGKPNDSIPPKERNELCRAFQGAVDFLWRRATVGKYWGFKTNRTAQEFADAHPMLYKCLKFIYQNNNKKNSWALSRGLRITPGVLAAVMYLMAQGRSEAHKWRNGPATEKKLDKSLWGQAESYWSGMAKPDKEGKLFVMTSDIIAALHSLEDEGLGGRISEKLCVIANSWALYLEGTKKFSEENLTLKYGRDAKGNVVIIDAPDFGGIDRGPQFSAPAESGEDDEDEELPEEEMEARKVEAKKAEEERKAQQRRERAEKLQQNRRAREATGKNGSKSRKE